MSIFKSATRVVKETRPSATVTKIPMTEQVQAELATKPNKRGKTPTLSLIQRGIDSANLSKADLSKLEAVMVTATRGDVFGPCSKIKQGLKGDVSLVKQGLADLIKLAVTEAPKVAPKKTTKAPKVTKAAKAAATKAPKETPKDEPKADEPKAKKLSLAQRKMAAIEALVAQNAEIISLLK